IDFLPKESIINRERKKIFWFGAVAGLAMLSKYQGAFLWIGVFLFVILYNRKWLKEYSFYLAGLISLVVLSPVLIWNVKNNFINFDCRCLLERTETRGKPTDFFLDQIPRLLSCYAFACCSLFN